MTDQHNDNQVHAYNSMLQRVKGFMEKAEHGAIPKLQQALQFASDKAIEVGELTAEEADKIAKYLQRDIQEAATYLGEHGDELKDWLKLDILLVENKLLEMFSQVVDQTTLELDRLAIEAQMSEWHTGEVTGIGVLECTQCGEHLHFHKSGHIPPCPKCHGTVFQRIAAED
jgi:Zn finger protein HypA/HybF involved in hydrogenase expression